MLHWNVEWSWALQLEFCAAHVLHMKYFILLADKAASLVEFLFAKSVAYLVCFAASYRVNYGKICSVAPPRGTWLRTHHREIEREGKKPTTRVCALPLSYNVPHSTLQLMPSHSRKFNLSRSKIKYFSTKAKTGPNYHLALTSTTWPTRFPYQHYTSPYH